MNETELVPGRGKELAYNSNESRKPWVTKRGAFKASVNEILKDLDPKGFGLSTLKEPQDMLGTLKSMPKPQR